MATFKTIIFTSKNHIKSDGTTNIKIRIYHRKESQYIPTPYYVNPEYFYNGYVTHLFENYTTLNYEVGELMQLYMKIYISLGSDRSSKMTCTELRDYIVLQSNRDTEFIDFVEFANSIIAETKRKNTASWYRYAVDVMCWFYGKDKINVLEITTNKLNGMMTQLAAKGMNGKSLEPGGISAYMKAIRSLFNKCKNHYNDEDFGIIKIPHDPFKRLEIPKAQRKKKNVPIEIVKQIRDFQCIKKRDEIAQDVFMIMFYLMGININDLYNLQGPRFGRIEYMRSKTDRNDNTFRFPLSIKIEPELQILIDKYSDVQFLSKIKDRYSSSHNFMKSVNKGLSNICDELRITKITTNWARHSWSSIARNKAKISVADIDFCLGHVNKDYKMADIYIETDYSIYDEANRKVLNLLLD